MNATDNPQQNLAAAVRANERVVLAALCLTAFMAALNFFATAPFYPVMSDDLSTSVPVLGQAATVMILLSAILGLLVGPLADRYGFRAPLALGVLAVAVTLIGIGLSPSLPYLFLFSVTGGLADALVFGLVFAVAGTWFTGPARTRAIGWTSGSLSIAPVLGVPILTFIGDLTSWRTALVVAGGVAIAACVIVWRALPDQARKPTGGLGMTALLAAFRPVLRNRTILTIYLINFLRGVGWLGFATYLGAYLEDRIGLETREIGLIYMLSGLGYAVGGFSTRPVLPWSLPVIMTVTSLATALGVAAMVLGEQLALIIVLLPVTSFLSSRGGIAINTMLADVRHEGTGTTMVLNGSVYNLAAAAGALVGGVLIGLLGYGALGIVIPLFAVAATVVAARFAGNVRTATV